MTDETNFTDPKADIAFGGTPEKPDHHNPQSKKAGSEMEDDGSTQNVTDEDGSPIDNPAG